MATLAIVGIVVHTTVVIIISSISVRIHETKKIFTKFSTEVANY